MTYDDVVALLRSWLGRAVVVELEPDGTVMEGRLAERDSTGIDGVLFTLSTSGVAVALFRDSVGSARYDADQLVVEQGRMTVKVRLLVAVDDPAA
jgi:hypothetical protein